MQFEDAHAHKISWENLNIVMYENGILSVYFKGFMVDSAQANRISVRKIYGCGDTTIPMEGRDYIMVKHCLSYPFQP